jgi:hypothetical protein
MNKEAVDLIKLYIHQTLVSDVGITPEAYETLINLLKVDKNMAHDLHSVVDSAVLNVKEHYISNETETSFEL